MRPRRLLFFAKIPMNYVLFEPVHRLLRSDPSIEFHFTGKYQGRNDPERVYESFDLAGGQIVRNSLARWKSYDAYVSPDFHLTGKRARTKVHMFHGVSMRNFAINKRVLEFDKLFILGPYMLRKFLERGILQPDDPRIEKVGFPKLDAVLAGRHDRARVLEDLGLDPSLPTVLLAPTWVKGGCLDVQGEEIVKTLGKLQINTIIKLHDNSYDLRKQRADFGAVLPPLLGPRQRLVRGFDSNPYLATADLLISDASSIANEFLVRDRPLVFFAIEDLEGSYPETDDQAWGTRTGTLVHRAEELLEVIPAALENPTAQADLRQEALQDFFYNPGCAAPVAAACLRRALGLPDNAVPESVSSSAS